MQYLAVGYAPISLARVTPLVGFPFVYAAAYQVADSRFDAFPRFPYTEAVTEEFQSADVGDFGLFSVDLELEPSLYKLGDTLSDAFGGTFAATED